MLVIYLSNGATIKTSQINMDRFRQIMDQHHSGRQNSVLLLDQPSGREFIIMLAHVVMSTEM